MRFPKTVKHRRSKATIYGKTASYAFYRVAFYSGGRRVVQSFKTYNEAMERAESAVRDLSSGSVASGLSPKQSVDAVAALERLEALKLKTGRSLSLIGVVSEYEEATSRLNGLSLGAAVDAYLNSVAVLTPTTVDAAMEEFIASIRNRSQSKDGKRPQISAKYAYNLEIQIRRFAESFPATQMADLKKGLIDEFFRSLSKFSAKLRNHHRAVLRRFFLWAVRKDYLPANHRLLESEGMRSERANTSEVEPYSPDEFATLLAGSEGPMRVLIAIGGMTGLRTAELLRLDWSDIWRVRDHIEVTAGKSKTRARRLVPIPEALARLLEPWGTQRAGRVWEGHEVTFQQHFSELAKELKIPRRANGLRHGFCTYHFALHSNENLTAAIAGNSPQMIHAHYRGLATRTEAENWFSTHREQEHPLA
ncbi:MAG: hypothetical protein FJ405_13730 [Verrucomicrobia bacterium]|nr:hypothetical protein [Verrucomicrobiota bacterium]